MPQNDEALINAQNALTALKRNPAFPFASYQTDIQHYMQLEMFFAYLFKTVVGGNAGGAWQAWWPPAKEQDGNPIFTAIHLGMSRGVKVIQNPLFPSKTGDPYFPLQPYLSESPADPFDSGKKVLVLCALADPSAESEKACVRFWRKFCVERASEEEMEKEIRGYEDEVRMPQR